MKRILELGMHDGLRTRRMLDLVRRTRGVGNLCYTGIDLFESSPRSDSARLSLKHAHCMLQPTGVRIRLVPGDPFAALSRAANSIGECDLIVVSADQAGESLERAWFYFPRLMHAATLVYVGQPGEGPATVRFMLLEHDKIRQQANAGTPRRTAA
ncbi:MAG TPA: hypothetical protein VNH11_04480 [Pirellulales bacterium]|nr:hypothetical protein [Pirellulales bacterium]